MADRLIEDESDHPAIINFVLTPEGVRRMKKCPFCAHKSAMLNNTHTPSYWVECTSCGASIPDPRSMSVKGTGERSHWGSAMRAIEAWNGRAGSTPHPKDTSHG